MLILAAYQYLFYYNDGMELYYVLEIAQNNEW